MDGIERPDITPEQVGRPDLEGSAAWHRFLAARAAEMARTRQYILKGVGMATLDRENGSLEVWTRRWVCRLTWEPWWSFTVGAGEERRRWLDISQRPKDWPRPPCVRWHIRLPCTRKRERNP